MKLIENETSNETTTAEVVLSLVIQLALTAVGCLGVNYVMRKALNRIFEDHAATVRLNAANAHYKAHTSL